MLKHLLPRGPELGIMLHRFVEEVEGGEADGYIGWPTPRAIFDLPVKLGHGVLALCLAIDAEHEHARQHLVEDYANSPHINLMTVAFTTAPVHTQLFWCHHQRRALKGCRAPIVLRC